MKKNLFSFSSFLPQNGLGKCLFAALFMGVFLSLPNISSAQTEFYIRTDTLNATGTPLFASLNSVRMWTTNVDGTSGGASRFPKNFTTASQVFNVNHTGYSSTGGWTISGSGSKLVIGYADSVITFVSTNTSNFSGTIDVLNNATFITRIASNSFKWGNLAVGSTVRYGANPNATQNIIAAKYYNLSLVQYGGSEYPYVFPQGGIIGVAGNYIGANGALNDCTFDFNGNGGQVINGGTYYNFTISGTKAVPDTLKGNLYFGGAFTLNYSGADPIFLPSSWVNFNGVLPQSYADVTFGNINNQNGWNHYVHTVNYAKSQINMYGTSSDFVVGNIINSAYGLYFPKGTTITAVSGNVLTVSNAPKVRVLIKLQGHISGDVPDTAYYIGFGTGNTIVMDTTPKFSVGDTLVGYHIGGYGANNAQSYVTAISGNNVTFAAPIYVRDAYSYITLGTANGHPSDKTITGTLNVTGNFVTGAGTKFNMAGSTVIYKGGKQMIMHSTDSTFAYNNLVIDEGDSSSAVSNGYIPVNGNLSILKGNVKLYSGQDIILGENATVTTASDANFVDGPFQKKFNSTTPFTFPSGIIENGKKFYRPITLTPQTASPKTYQVRVSGTYKTKSLSSPLLMVDSLTYGINKISGIDSLAKIGLTYNFIPAPVTLSTLQFSGFSNSDSVWHTIGNNTNAVSSTFYSGTLTSSDYLNPAAYARFTIGLTDTTLLPIKLVSLIGKATSQGNKISWSTSSEINSASFIVERKLVSGDFETIGEISAKGNSAGIVNYSFVDNKLPVGLGTNYYRIAEVDKDGKIVYSSVISIATENSLKSITFGLYPIPTHQILNVKFTTSNSGTLNLSITDILGRIIKTENKNIINGENLISLNVSSLHSGTYFLNANDGTSKQVLKFQLN